MQASGENVDGQKSVESNANISREEYIDELKKSRAMLEETLEKRGALLATLEQRLKEATESAATQVCRLVSMCLKVATVSSCS